MLKLFYTPGACSLASHIVLEELKIPYEKAKVDLKSHRVGSEDYYQINPRGAVPALMLDDNGKLLTQNLAILMYLGDLDTKNQLIPKEGTFERVRCLEWLSFITSDLHKAFSPLFGPQRFVDSDGAREELKHHTQENIQKLFVLVDKKLAGNSDYALGKYFSVVDAYLFVFYQWSQRFNLPFNQSNYVALVQKILDRPAVQNALLEEGLNPTACATK